MTAIQKYAELLTKHLVAKAASTVLKKPLTHTEVRQLIARQGKDVAAQWVRFKDSPAALNIADAFAKLEQDTLRELIEHMEDRRRNIWRIITEKKYDMLYTIYYES